MKAVVAVLFVHALDKFSGSPPLGACRNEKRDYGR